MEKSDSSFSTRIANARWDMVYVQIPLYSLIFLAGVIGNILVILTLVQHQRMRTVTNVFLLNLAASDIMLGVLCMPFTLVGAILRDFVFGEVMCKLVPYLQACTVSVSAWTLVAISVERYYAICHPLRSRRWQTLSHSYRLIAVIWTGSLILMSPIAVLSELKPTSNGHQKCRENWPGHGEYEKAYNLILDAVLLIFPLIILVTTYTLITITLQSSVDPTVVRHSAANGSVVSEVYLGSRGDTLTRCSLRTLDRTPSSRRSLRLVAKSSVGGMKPWDDQGEASQRSTRGRSAMLKRKRKRRIVEMLCVVVLEFFLFWTPLYVINTVALFSPDALYDGLNPTWISYFHLLAFCSSCCNPITYCFMSSGFRKSFSGLFTGCCSRACGCRKRAEGRYREPP
ncbi:cholecystokinin receptor-like [Neodiprion pinetum]|uniref:Cholecystokinin receptor-like n=1 Tax=Neodiprion lecontei TaxID=441921 RepID=A0ABM3GJE5_NEOLC|nr:cholecystokinin receptor-like [Neodiprion fabricii]XP_046433092.1 cholecystokinin receptor-like [Neodiprion fabricii]XP_046433093.1 cholecystokinin receptor-like [Neodiprion fabricii]XP_046433094.1 cholecystokinin receptor-like [Neodiprion fabricii]XP_046489711.1 cholecystokinin receptor-like [Neodiprion pinetum]XP_046489713.1 cholecystokinin receptor-like [Neodiprion pinetum]XP_046489714.1 cholecystokinin receptor-like [Neodiprion pinetum]XP_046489715.1 cholecystokinin receptor-like [Neo